MAATPVQKTNLPWQVRHLGKNFWEWVQLQLAGQPQQGTPTPSWELPAWVGQIFFWALATAGVILLAFLLVQLLDQVLAGRSQRRPRRPIVTPLVEAKPHSVAEWLRLAKQYEQARNWREACRALYMAALQLLADRNWIPHQVGRTDRAYLQAIQGFPQPRPWQLLIRTHERSLFGGDPLSGENFQRCRHAYEEIEKR
jgi:hypothetical protein